MRPIRQVHRGPAQALLLAGVLVAGMTLAACHHDPRGESLGQTLAPGEVAWTAPETSTIPPGEAGQAIQRGQDIFAHTPTAAAKYVGNGLACRNCHLKDGIEPFAAPMVGVTHRYPAFSKRAGKTVDLKERIEECMVRSENGRPMPEDGQTMNDLVAYMTWLSQKVPAGAHLHGGGLIKVQAPAHVDAANGQKLYATICANCHGPDGAGSPPAYPPLWGPDSFNAGAGMAKPAKMAAFVLKNMPFDQPGSMTVQQAFDVAAYVASKPRPAMNPAYKSF